MQTATTPSAYERATTQHPLIETIALALQASQDCARARQSREQDADLDRTQWHCAEAWLAALTGVRLQALQALPPDLYDLL